MYIISFLQYSCKEKFDIFVESSIVANLIFFIAFTYIHATRIIYDLVDYWDFVVWIFVDVFSSLCYYRMFSIRCCAVFRNIVKTTIPCKADKEPKKKNVVTGCCSPHCTEPTRKGLLKTDSEALKITGRKRSSVMCSIIISGRLQSGSNVVFIG